MVLTLESLEVLANVDKSGIGARTFFTQNLNGLSFNMDFEKALNIENGNLNYTTPMDLMVFADYAGTFFVENATEKFGEVMTYNVCGLPVCI